MKKLIVILMLLGFTVTLLGCQGRDTDLILELFAEFDRDDIEQSIVQRGDFDDTYGKNFIANGDHTNFLVVDDSTFLTRYVADDDGYATIELFFSQYDDEWYLRAISIGYVNFERRIEVGYAASNYNFDDDFIHDYEAIYQSIKNLTYSDIHSLLADLGIGELN